jgi:hypothetical protein
MLSALLLLAAAAASAQTFEVAAVHPAAPLTGENALRPRIATDPVRLTARDATLLDCIEWAWNVREYQVARPDWIRTAKFDIAGPKLRAAAPTEGSATDRTGPGLRLTFTARTIADLAAFLSTLAVDRFARDAALRATRPAPGGPPYAAGNIGPGPRRETPLNPVRPARLSSMGLRAGEPTFSSRSRHILKSGGV